MTCFYSFHSNFGGKFSFALFLFSSISKVSQRCMKAQHLFIGVGGSLWRSVSYPIHKFKTSEWASCSSRGRRLKVFALLFRSDRSRSGAVYFLCF